MTSSLRHISVCPIQINYVIMFYLISKFHDNNFHIFEFMEGGTPPPPHPGPGTPKKPRRNRVKTCEIIRNSCSRHSQVQNVNLDFLTKNILSDKILQTLKCTL